MILRRDYGAQDAYVAPAQPKAEIWRSVCGVVLAILGYVALGRMFLQVLYGLTAQSNPALPDQVFHGVTPAGLLVLLLTFGCMTLSVGVVARVLHFRSPLSLLGPVPLAIRQFCTVFVPLLGFGAVLFMLPPWDYGGPLVPNLSVALWLTLLPLSLLAVFVQVSAEEVFFRGYIQQQLAARFRSPLVWMVLPSVLFAAGHYMADEAGENALAIAVWAGVFGLLMADITARAGSLGPAIALHFYNNITAILVISMSDSLSGLALFLAPFGLADVDGVRAWLPVDFAHMFVAWLVARLAIRR